MSLKFDTPITEVPLFHQGKVRDMYDLGDSFLMVASDRLSAFDVVLPTPIPGKGKILNQLTNTRPCSRSTPITSAAVP